MGGTENVANKNFFTKMKNSREGNITGGKTVFVRLLLIVFFLRGIITMLLCKCGHRILHRRPSTGAFKHMIISMRYKA